MTIKQIYEKAEFDLYKNKITIGEFAKIIGQEVVIIPDNATNGDMMKTLFKNAIIEERDYGVIIFSISNLPLWYANKDWWNTPYKLSKLKGKQE